MVLSAVLASIGPQRRRLEMARRIACVLLAGWCACAERPLLWWGERGNGQLMAAEPKGDDRGLEAERSMQDEEFAKRRWEVCRGKLERLQAKVETLCAEYRALRSVALMRLNAGEQRTLVAYEVWARKSMLERKIADASRAGERVESRMNAIAGGSSLLWWKAVDEIERRERSEGWGPYTKPTIGEFVAWADQENRRRWLQVARDLVRTAQPLSIPLPAYGRPPSVAHDADTDTDGRGHAP